MSGLDGRLNAFRPDLADARLRGQVEAERLAEGREAAVVAPVADVRSAPREDAGLDTQWLRGERVRCFEERDGWCWAQSLRDGYVGYVRAEQIGEPGPAPTHRIIVPATFVYAADDMTTPRRDALSLGTEVAVGEVTERRGTRYARIDGLGFVVMQHLRPLDEPAGDSVAVAEMLEHAPHR